MFDLSDGGGAVVETLFEFNAIVNPMFEVLAVIGFVEEEVAVGWCDLMFSSIQQPAAFFGIVYSTANVYVPFTNPVLFPPILKQKKKKNRETWIKQIKHKNNKIMITSPKNCFFWTQNIWITNIWFW